MWKLGFVKYFDSSALFPLSNLSVMDFDVWCPCDVRESVCMIVHHCSDPFQLPQEERGRDIFKIMLK